MFGISIVSIVTMFTIKGPTQQNLIPLYKDDIIMLSSLLGKNTIRKKDSE